MPPLLSPGPAMVVAVVRCWRTEGATVINMFLLTMLLIHEHVLLLQLFLFVAVWLLWEFSLLPLLPVVVAVAAACSC